MRGMNDIKKAFLKRIVGGRRKKVFGVDEG
jgi:hypothetical protein